MVYWMQKNKTEVIQEPENTTQNDEKSSREKRLDNLRVYHTLDVELNSIGNKEKYSYKTRDISASGIFLPNRDFKSLPFLVNSTLICADLCLKKHPKTQNDEKISFIAKVARVVYPDQSFPKITPGLGLRMVQISEKERTLLNTYVAHYGEMENDTTQNSFADAS